jgi:hypothetical protein
MADTTKVYSKEVKQKAIKLSNVQEKAQEIAK